MKKQFLFLILFVAAIVAGTTSAFAQKAYTNVISGGPTQLIPNTLNGCTADELHPVQGQVYTYTVNASAQTDVRWFVVNNNDVIANGDSLIGYGGVLPSTDGTIDPSNGLGEYIYGDGSTVIPEYNINPVPDATGQHHSIDIAWKYFDGLTDQVLLVAYAEDSVGCTDNIVVYRIIPQPAFTLDVAALNDAGDSIAGPLDPVVGECVSPIEAATYSGSNTTPDAQLTVDYGENWVFFVVNGANYIDSWLPRFQITYDGAYDALEAEWAYASDATNSSATWNTIDVSGAWGTVPVIAGGAANNAGDGVVPAAGGEQIVVRVRIDYGTGAEHDDATELLHFAVDGIAYDGSGTGVSDWYDDTAFADLHYTDCTADDFDNDKVDYEITPRPEVENAIAAPVDTEDKTGDEIN